MTLDTYVHSLATYIYPPSERGMVHLDPEARTAVLTHLYYEDYLDSASFGGCIADVL